MHSMRACLVSETILYAVSYLCPSYGALRPLAVFALCCLFKNIFLNLYREAQVCVCVCVCVCVFCLV